MARISFVTVVMGQYYKELAGDNRIQREKIAADRGVILDRNGKMLAGNIAIDNKIYRYYPDGEVFAGLLGYVSDGNGVAGLEKQYNKDLIGVEGERLTEETSSGKEMREISKRDPVSGKTITTNIDYGLQLTAYRALKEKMTELTNKSGSVIVARISGEVLSLVSLPSYDPNLFVASGKRGLEGGVYSGAKGIIEDEVRMPLFNRVISGAFAPGSVYKLLTSLAGLETGVVSKDDLIDDFGEIVVGDYRFGNWLFDKYGKTEGKINMAKAIARSNDIYFYKLGERIGVDNLVKWAKKLGVGEKTKIDLPGEMSGLLPTPLWMEKEKGERWYLGNTYHMAIGQGDLLLTPLQVNRMTAEVVSGKSCVPRLYGAGECDDLGLTAKNRMVVMGGMEDACKQGGTAFTFFDLKKKVICKTGTAQHGGDKTRPHSWLTVVVPKSGDGTDYKNFENGIVVTVQLEEAGEGSSEAGAVARKIVDYLLDKEL